MLDANYIGKAALDDSFKFDEPIQQHVLRACSAVGAGIDHSAAEFSELVGFHSDSGFGAVDCWPYDLSIYTKKGNYSIENNITVPGNPFQLSTYQWPVPEAQLAPLMEEWMGSIVPGSIGTTFRDKYSWMMGWDSEQRKVSSREASATIITDLVGSNPSTHTPKKTHRSIQLLAAGLDTDCCLVTFCTWVRTTRSGSLASY
jgi:hypothetical protein